MSQVTKIKVKTFSMLLVNCRLWYAKPL